MLKRLLPLLVLALLILAGCGKEEDNRLTFTVGFDANFPPYGYKNADGEYVGYDLDLAEEVARRNGWRLVKKPINWDAKDSELNSGNIDCIWNGFTINGRENDYEWTKPYVDNSQVVVVLKDSSIKTFEDLAGKTVVAQTDTPVLKALQKGGKLEKIGSTFKELRSVGNYNQAVMELEAGGCDAVAVDIGIYITKLDPEIFRKLDQELMKEEYGIGFKKGNTELRDIVQKTFDEMVKDGTAAEIHAKYFDVKNPLYKEKISFMQMIKQLLKGFGVAIVIFALTMILALPLGLLVAFGRMSKVTPLRWICTFYISVLRGTPLMLQLLVWYFAPYYLFGFKLDLLSIGPIGYNFTAVIIGFALNYAAYFAEIYRSGIESMPKGQYEAAMVLGYTRAQTFFRIILPQVIKRILPPITNETITLVKDTSLAFSLAVLEMFTVAREIASTYTIMMPLIIAGLFYYIFNFIVAYIMGQIEKKLNYYR